MDQRQPVEIELITKSRRHNASRPELRERERKQRTQAESSYPLIMTEQPRTNQANLNVHQNCAAHVQL